MKLKYAVLGSLVAFPFLAAAAGQTGSATINVTADVNSAVAMVSQNNGALTDISLNFVPGQGLLAGSEMVRLASNDTQHGVDVSLANDVQLTNGTDASTIDMSVTLANKPVTKAAKANYAKSLFTNGETAPMQLTIKPTAKDTTTMTAGHYTGTINLVLAQSTT